MGKVRKEFTLPEWAFLDGAGPDGAVYDEYKGGDKDKDKDKVKY